MLNTGLQYCDITSTTQTLPLKYANPFSARAAQWRVKNRAH